MLLCVARRCEPCGRSTTSWIAGLIEFQEFAEAYACETLAAEEAFDVGQLLRGFVATVRGFDMLGRLADLAINAVKMTVVVYAKDIHDEGNSDTAMYGSQKSLAFTVAWLRSILRKPNTSLKWTSTENM